MALNLSAHWRDQPHSPSFPPTASTTPPLTLDVGARCEQGRRPNNEDRYFSDVEQRLFIVADGMGGQEDGEKASQFAVEMIPRYVRDHLPGCRNVRKMLQQAIEATNLKIVDAGKHHPPGRRMGTTVVAALHYRNRAYVVGVGDSRIYLIRGDEVQLLTVDHTLADALVRNGDLTEEQAETSQWKHVLYKFLGNAEMRDKADVCSFLAEPGDRLLLASDGLTNFVTEQDLQEGARPNLDVQEWVDSLVDRALTRGSRDNVTCIVAAFELEEGS